MTSKPSRAPAAPIDPYAFLSSPLFTLTIDPPSSTDEPKGSTTTTSSSSNPLSFTIHKSLLASLSPELHNHVHNTMREGLTSSMHLREVDQPTIVSFLVWAYRGSYPDHPFYIGAVPGAPSDIYPSTLVQHAKLYVFAERFNVLDLKRHIFDKMTALLRELDEGAALRIEWVADKVLEAMGVCFEELPSPDTLLAAPAAGKILCDVCGLDFPSNNQRWKHLRATDHHRPKEFDERATPMRLLRWFCQFLAYTIADMRTHPSFWPLMQSYPDVQRAVFEMLGPAEKAPWGVQRPAGDGAESKRTVARLTVVRPGGDGQGALRYTD